MIIIIIELKRMAKRFPKDIYQTIYELNMHQFLSTSAKVAHIRAYYLLANTFEFVCFQINHPDVFLFSQVRSWSFYGLLCIKNMTWWTAKQIDKIIFGSCFKINQSTAL